MEAIGPRDSYYSPFGNHQDYPRSAYVPHIIQNCLCPTEHGCTAMHFLLDPPKKNYHAGGFKTPPLDGSLTISELYDFHYKNNPAHPVFLHQNTSGNISRLTFSKVVPAAHNAARLVAKRAIINLDEEGGRPTIAILATTDTITYFTTVLGMLRAEIIVFVISPRNSPAAVAHLLAKARPSHLLVSIEVSIQELARNAMQELDDIHIPTILTMPTYGEIFTPDCKFASLPPRRRDLSATRIIVHSSGSTSFPKLVTWNDRSFLQVAMVPLFGAHEFCGSVFGCHAVTMFHGIGLNFIAWLASTGLVMATFPPASPSIIPTPETVWSGSLATRPSYLFGPPVFFEGWSRDPAKLPFFKQLRGVVYGGAPLQKAIGDDFAGEGVAVYTLYGSTEVGVYGALFPENPGLDWEYVSMNPHCAAEFIPLGDGTYELVIVAKPITELSVGYNSTFDGQDAYATNDILVPHPIHPNRWKVLGRKDDQIMLNTGEKTNPGPLEAILCQHPHISSAVMFGRGRFQNGVLVELKKEYSFDPNDDVKLQTFRENIWPRVEEMNSAAPTHSRLFKEMIIVADPLKPFPYTPKGAPRRAAILSNYSSEIDKVYSDTEKVTRATPPASWSGESSLIFARDTVNAVLKLSAGDHDDIFERGCDSLQAMWIRQSIIHTLRITVNKTYIMELIQQPDKEAVDEKANLELYLTSYARDFPCHSPGTGIVTTPNSTRSLLERYLARYLSVFKTHYEESDIILITGTTGSLGSAVLAKLVASASVRKIYAFNRKSREGIDLVKRQKRALEKRGYDPKIVGLPKVVLVEGELTKAGLHIDPILREEIRKSITHILHLAWRVDFNLSLSSFENAIGGTRALVDLALSSPRATPPRLLFASSVGIFRNNPTSSPILEIPVEDSSTVLGQGYTESKWMAEQILYEAAKATSLRPIVVRVGQISGGLNGSWNTSDWVPAIVKSSLKLRSIPELRGSCSWVPLDFAADALVDLRSASTETGIFHLVHPQPPPSREIFKIISEELSLPLEPLSDWVRRLEDLIQTEESQTRPDESMGNQLLEALPAAKMLDFFKTAAVRESDSKDAMGIPSLDITNALSASDKLKGGGKARTVGSVDVHLWLKYWREIGFIP